VIIQIDGMGEKTFSYFLYFAQIEALKHVGVTEIVLAINYRPEVESVRIFQCNKIVYLYCIFHYVSSATSFPGHVQLSETV
jgi:hypothetical protein